MSKETFRTIHPWITRVQYWTLVYLKKRFSLSYGQVVREALTHYLKDVKVGETIDEIRESIRAIDRNNY